MGDLRVQAVWKVALMSLLALLPTACVSAPLSRPQIGCEFDSQRRFQYILIIRRDEDLTRWRRRILLTNKPDPLDLEEHSSKSSLVRPGYCPDESLSVLEGRSVWLQPEDSPIPDPEDQH